MASYAYTFTSGDTVTPTKLNNARTVSDIVSADIKSDAAIALSKLATGALPTAITVATANILDGNVTLAKLVTAVQQALLPVGAVQAFARSTAPAGWLSANGNTVGSASSGATNASADYSALFAVLWDNWSNTDLPILDSAGAASTRGASASADFSANKRLPLPDLRGIFVRGSGEQTISGVTYNKTFSAKEGDAFQNFTGTITTTIDLLGGTGAFAAGSAGSSLRPTGATTTRGVTFDPSTVARTSTETRPANIALLYCIKF
jgi:hypothetical protein